MDFPSITHFTMVEPELHQFSGLKTGFLFGLLIGLFQNFISAQDDESKQYAPPEAYLNGSPLPYFGSEGAWNRRAFSPEKSKVSNKRRGQRQILAIMEGRTGEAVALCQAILANNPDDQESLFNLTIAHCQMGQMEEAVASMMRALKAGLPFGRFLAGPRDLLKPLQETKQFKDLDAEFAIRLIHGPMIGAVTDQSVKLWVRTDKIRQIEARLGTSPKLANPIKSQKKTSRADRDYTAVLEVDGLSPGTEYFYQVLIDGVATLSPKLPSFRTFPAKGSSGRFHIAFGGGAGYTPWNERIWDVIASHRYDAFLTLGDNVYIDLPGFPGPLHDYTYYRRQSRPEFRRLVSSTPVFAIWDDHDCAIDDIWMGPYIDRPKWKIPQWRLFRNNWNNPAYGDEESTPGCWFRFSLGDIDFFMLDGRFYRTNPFGKNPTMLGPVQKKWLLDGLQKSQATFKMIVSPVPWDFRAKPDSVDTWKGFPTERNEIFAFLNSHKIEGVVLVSSDRHRTDAWKIVRDAGYPLYDFQSACLTNMLKTQIMPGALMAYNEKCSFGAFTFDTKKDDPELTFQIINIDDEIIDSLTLKKSQLTH